MSQMADFIVFDGASVPVQQDLVAISSKTNSRGDTESVWRTATPGLPANLQLEVIQIQSTLPSGVVRTETRTTVPVFETVAGGAPKLLFTDKLVTIAYAHPSSTIDGRRSARHLHSNVLMGANWTSPALATGNIAEGMDLLATPL